MRRYVAVGIWLAMTVAATLIVWEAVSVVAADVTDRPAPVVAHRDVVVALAGSSPGTTTTTVPSTTSTTVAPSAAPSTTIAPARGGSSTAVSGGRTGPATGPVFVPVTTTVPRTSPTTRAPTPPTTAPTTAAPIVGGSATYSTPGGVVAVGCTSFDTIRLVAALPNDGYQVQVTSGSGLFVQVNFVGEGQTFQVSAACFFGQPFQANNKNGSSG